MRWLEGKYESLLEAMMWSINISLVNTVLEHWSHGPLFHLVFCSERWCFFPPMAARYEP